MELSADAVPAMRGKTLAAFQRIRTRAVGFVVFDRLLITVHPAGCYTARIFIERYLADAVQSDGADASSAAAACRPARPT